LLPSAESREANEVPGGGFGDQWRRRGSPGVAGLGGLW
jgi:hypothetical protein